jgi:hypothetical protein
MPVNILPLRDSPLKLPSSHRRSPTEFSIQELPHDQRQKIGSILEEAALKRFNDPRNISTLLDHNVEELRNSSKCSDPRHRRIQSSIPKFTSNSLQTAEEPIEIEHFNDKDTFGSVSKFLDDYDHDLFKDFRAFYSDVVRILNSKDSFKVIETNGKKSNPSFKFQRNALLAKIALKTALAPLVLVNSGVWKAVDGARKAANIAVVALKKIRDPFYDDSGDRYPHPYYRKLADEKERLQTAKNSIISIKERLNKLIEKEEENLKTNSKTYQTLLRDSRDTQVERDAVLNEQKKFKADLLNDNIEIDNFSEKLTHRKANLQDPKVKIGDFPKELEIVWKLSKLSSNPKKLEDRRVEISKLNSSIKKMKGEIRIAAITNLFQSKSKSKSESIKNIFATYNTIIPEIPKFETKIEKLEKKIKNLYLLPRKFTVEGMRLDIVRTQLVQVAINNSINKNSRETNTPTAPIKVQISNLTHQLAALRSL